MTPALFKHGSTSNTSQPLKSSPSSLPAVKASANRIAAGQPP
jgi:hypothetical protein